MFKHLDLWEKLLMVFVILSAVSAVTLYFYFVNQDYSPSTTRSIFKKQIVTPPPKKDCASSDVFEYLAYKEVPEDEAKNNKFGLYIYAERRDFMDLAEELVNSNGGDWGYVLIPYNVKDSDYGKWRDVFLRLRSKRLIPIIQLWDVDLDDYEKQTEQAAEFLDSFVWPIRQRYVSVYNEPNDAKFWRGKADPEQYAKVLDQTIDVFKAQNSNFFMMNGALNISARSGRGYIDGFEFMRRMNDEVPGIFTRLDGWASHPYPQPNFSGSPHDSGRDSIRAYETELDFLKNSLSVEKELPVFITETGWAHNEGIVYNASYPSVSEVAEYMKIAFEDHWLPDDKVQAVTPFTIWYAPPYDHFSWIDKDHEPYEHYNVVKSLEKVAGRPESLDIEEFSILECE